MCWRNLLHVTNQTQLSFVAKYETISVQLVATTVADLWGWFYSELQKCVIKQKLIFQTHFLGFHAEFEQGVDTMISSGTSQSQRSVAQSWDLPHN